MEIDFSKLNPQELRDIFGNTFGGGTGNSGAGNNTSAGNDVSSGNSFLDAITKGILKSIGNNTYTPPSTDPTFTSGLNYAQSIAGGQNVPNMIAPGTSFSSAIPGGFTQDDINRKGFPNPFDPNPIYNPPGGGPGGGGYNPPGKGGGDGVVVNPPVVNPPVSDPVEPPINFPPINFPPINIGGPVEPPINIGGPVPDPVIPPIGFPPINFPPIDPPINVGGPVGGPMPDPVFPPMPPINVGGPVDLPGMGGPSMFPIPPISIGGVGGGLDLDNYVVPEVPLNNLLNQSPPQGPVGMSPQETAKMSSQQELLNLMSNKDILKEIPADDGVRNQYQVELDEYINKSPINMDTYKEELPIGSAINLGIPSIMETVVPMAVPGLSLAKNISDSFQNNFSPSPSPSPQPSISSFTPGIDYSSVRKFGR